MLRNQGSKRLLENAKIVGFEDGYFPPPFKGSKGFYTVLASVLTENISPIDVYLSLIEIDGLDATEKALNILAYFKKEGKSFDIVLLGGITYAGFNIIDPVEVYEVYEVPVVVITQDKPRDKDVEKALRKHFIDWKKRLMILKKFRSKAKVFKIVKGKTKLYIQPLGIEPALAQEIVKTLIVKGTYPEPLRLAKHIATALGKLIFSKYFVS